MLAQKITGNVLYLNEISDFLPEIFLSSAIVLLLVIGAIKGEINLTPYSVITLLITLIIGLQTYSISLITTIKVITLISTMGILLMGRLSPEANGRPAPWEYNVLILVATLGLLLLIDSNDLIMLYLSIEMVSLSFYVLAAIKRTGQYSTEAGLKYFLLGGLSSGLLLFGSAVIYAVTGETNFINLSNYIWFVQEDLDALVLGGVMIISALLFKLAAAPFHMWAPDVYEGSPTLITAYFTTVPKLSILGILSVVLFGPLFGIFSQLQTVLLISSVMCLLVGSISALNQTKIKRVFAYSAIGHIGYVLMGLIPGTIVSIQASFIYVVLYIIMSFNTWAFITTAFSKSGFGDHANNFIGQLSGISRTHPVLGITFALCLLSIAGIPPLAGFLSKYLVILSAVSYNFISLAIIAVLTSVISCFFYLRIIKWMYFSDSSDFYLKELGDICNKVTQISLSRALILGASLYLLLTLLLYPAPLFNLFVPASLFFKLV